MKMSEQEAKVAAKIEVRDGSPKSKPAVKGSPSPEAIARRNRRTRSPIDGRRNILTVKGLAPGMVGRWVDNTPERVEELLDRGYEVVRENVEVGDMAIESGAKMGSVVTKRTGGGKESILMQIPEEWYNADQKEKQKVVDSREAAMRQGDKAQNFYGKVEVQDVVPNRRPASRRGEE
jgi:hypothetical protein